MGTRIGWASALSAIAVVSTWCARTFCWREASRLAGGRCSARFSLTGRLWRRKLWARLGFKRAAVFVARKPAVTHLIPRFGDRPIRTIERADIVTLLDALGTHPARRRAAYSYLRHFFQWALERDLVDHNPCLAIRSPRLAASRDRVLTDDEIRALWQADSVFAHINCLSLLTAQRRGSIGQMRRDQIDFAARLWSIPAAGMKSGRAHDVPLSDLAIAELSAIPALSGPYVFGVGSDGWKPYGGASNGMDGLRTQLYGKDWRETGQGDWRTHDLRRTAVTLAQREGCSIEEIRALTQHRIPGVIGVYARHAYTQEKREVVNAIARRVLLILPVPTETGSS